MSRFKLVQISMGSGWPSVHVAIDKHYSWPSSKDEVCLTLDAQNASEVSVEIDNLIQELQDLKAGIEAKFRSEKQQKLEA